MWRRCLRLLHTISLSEGGTLTQEVYDAGEYLRYSFSGDRVVESSVIVFVKQTHAVCPLQ
jgi:hypothetical protein